MYAIIYWRTGNDDEVFPLLTQDGQLKVFDKLAHADSYAGSFEESFASDARVISCEQVHE